MEELHHAIHVKEVVEGKKFHWALIFKLCKLCNYSIQLPPMSSI